MTEKILDIDNIKVRYSGLPVLQGVSLQVSQGELDAQIRNFRDGVRGSSADDEHGHTMALMSQGLESDEQIADIVAYIQTLKKSD